MATPEKLLVRPVAARVNFRERSARWTWHRSMPWAIRLMVDLPDGDLLVLPFTRAQLRWSLTTQRPWTHQATTLTALASRPKSLLQINHAPARRPRRWVEVDLGPTEGFLEATNGVVPLCQAPEHCRDCVECRALAKAVLRDAVRSAA